MFSTRCVLDFCLCVDSMASGVAYVQNIFSSEVLAVVISFTCASLIVCFSNFDWKCFVLMSMRWAELYEEGGYVKMMYSL